MLFYIFIIGIIILSLYLLFKNNKKTEPEDFCNLNMDKIKIIRRGESYSKMLDDLINKKKVLFNDKQIKIMKNKNQYYDISNDDIKNISYKIYNNCKKNFSSEIGDNIPITKKKYKNREYDAIMDNLNKEIKNSSSYDGNGITVLENENYLKNYYIDIFGDRVQSNLDDYFANYYLTIDDDYGEIPKEVIKVNVVKGNNNFIIPNQYNNNKHMTNAYNVDWSRIINPITYY